MASGKTRLGKRLAAKLRYDFIDLDEQIELAKQASIPTIFEQEGEEEFREIECETLRATQHLTQTIISCGGGSPCYHNNAEWMNEHGTTIFLSVDEAVLLDRLWRNRNSRPLVANLKSTLALEEYIQKELDRRMQFYSTAQIHYDNTYPKSDLSDLLQYITA